MAKIPMDKGTRSCLGFVASCFFAVWGCYLNGFITAWLWWQTQQFEKQQKAFGGPFISMMIGLLFGFVTPYIFFSKDARLARQTGFIFVFIVMALFSYELRGGASLIVCCANYSFSFLWASSLIAVGYLSRSRPKNGAA